MNLLSVLRQRSQKLLRQSKLTACQKLTIEVLEDRAVPTVSGVAFQDFNSNGVRDLTAVVTSPSTATVSAAVDRGIAGVTVTAFDALGVNRGSVVTDAFGAYTLTVSGAQTDPLRVEFTTLPTGFTSGPRGVDSGTSVQFVPNASATNVNFGAVRPVDHSQDNPLVATSVYAFGDQQSAANATMTTLVAFPYSSGGTTTAGFVNPNPATPVLSVPASQVGTTLGLGYAKDARDLYASAYFKRFAGFGPSGTGAIYKVPVPAVLPANYQPPAGSLLYADLNAIFGANTAGANLHDTADYDTDNGNTGWAAVGTSSLGGLDVSSDGQFIFVMNLADRQLYRVPTTGTVDATTVKRVSIPLGNPDGTGAIITAARFVSNDLRPFAVEYHDGKVYVGVVYTAQTNSTGAGDQAARDELLAAVYTVDPATMTFNATPVFTTRLNYTRSQSIYVGTSNWEPWSATYFSTQGNGALGIAPQPMLTGITFDAQGNMTLGLRDRGADQNGFFTLSDPAQPGVRIEGFTGGDTLRATITTVDDLASGWTIENNSRVPNNITASPATLGTGPQSNTAGPGGGEFFYQDSLGTIHAETSIGGTAQIPGSPDVLTTAMDPGDQTRAGGVSFFSTLTGAKDKAYELYHTTSDNNPVNGGTFGKANGMGELVILSDVAPIEVGNRVFFDANGDGVQGANEPGIADVTVRLYAPDGRTVLATAVTDATGDYIFSNAAGTTTASTIYGIAGLTANTAGFSIRLDNASDYLAGGPLFNRIVTKALNDPSANGTSRDSDAVRPNATLPVGGANPGTITFSTGANGQNVHTYDAGFSPPLSLGNRVFLDANNNGLRDATEGGVAGVTVTLFTAASVSVGAVVTDANGYYLFTGLQGGSYYVELSTIPNGLRSSTGSGVTGGLGNFGPFEGAGTPSADTNVDNDDNGTQVGAIVRSTVITLALTTEPTGEADVGPQADTATDASSNLTLDLGLIRTFSLGNRVWNDVNNDGLLNNAEAGIDGATVRLLDAAGNPVLDAGGVAVATVTANGGYYRFDGLTAGDYRVQVDGGGPLAGYLSSSGTNGSLTGPSEPAPSPNADTDNVDKGSVSGANFRSGVVTLGPTNVEPTTETDFGPGDAAAAPNDQSNLTVDFGFFQPVSLGNLVWNDANNDGLFDNGEAGFANVTVRLLDATGNPVLGVGGLPITTSTNGSGQYLFTNLGQGSYIVEIVAPAGYSSSQGVANAYEPAPSPNNGIDNDDNGTSAGGQVIRSLPVTVAAGTAPTGEPALIGLADAVPDASANYTVDFGLYTPPPLSLGNRVWEDLNNNGVRDAGEPGVAGVVVTLFSSLSASLGVTTTDANGYYLFTNLTPGTYYVELSNLLGRYASSTGTGATGGVSGFGPFEGANTPSGNTNVDNDDNGSQVGDIVRSTPITLTPFLAPTKEGDVGPQVDTATDINSNLTLDLGLVRVYTLGNRVWNDANNDGLLDNGETGIDGATVRLLTADGTPVLDASGAAVTTRTVGGGYYAFGNLTPGNYRVQVDGGGPLTGLVSSSGTNGSATGPNEPAPGGNADSVDKGSAFGANFRSGVVTLGPGANAPTGETDVTETPFIVVDDQSNFTVDFGFYQPVSLGNLVWNDANNNGLRDAGEPGLGGVTVRVYDSANALLATTITDANGNYTFGNLTPGSYSIEADLPTGFVSSSGTNGSPTGPFETAPAAGSNDNEDNGTKTTGQTVRSTPVTVGGASGNANTTIDFGGYLPLSLGNRVWDDLNNNGVRDAGEPGLAGVTVTLFTAASVAVATAVTDANGYYLFTNLNPNGYYVELSTLPATYVSSTGAAGGVGPFEGANTPSADTNTDNDDNGTQVGPIVRSTVITLAVGAAPTGETDVGPQVNNASDANTNLTLDLGLTRTYSLGNRVFVDVNNDGRLNPGEAGMDGATVRLLDAAGNPILTPGGVAVTTVTANGGYYRFDGLPAGDYRVQVDGTGPLLGYRSSTGASGVAGTAGPFEVAPSPNTAIDGDDNGTQLGANARSGAVTLGPGNSAPTGETDLSPTDRSTPDAQSNLTVDFGFFRPMSLGNRVFLDANNNGVFDAGDSAPAGPVTLNLLDGAGNPVLDGTGKAVTTVTNAQGYYSFTGLNPGKYQVGVAASNLAAGGVLAAKLSSTGGGAGSVTGPNEPAPATPVDNADSGTASLAGVLSPVVTLVDGTAPTGEPDAAAIADPTADADSNLTVDFGFYQPLTLGNLVWNDLNNNGTRDANEPGLANVPVRLFNAAGTLVASTTTDGNGNYLFTKLTPGDYSVEADLPAGFVSSSGTNGSPTGPFETAPSPNDHVDNDDNGTKTTGQTVRSSPVTLAGGGTNSDLTVDFGAYTPLSLGNLVWNDLNNNGTRDAGEPGLANVPVQLFNAAGNLVTSTTTDANGNYLFSNLTPGEYTVGVAPPAGFTLSTNAGASPNNNVDNDNNGTQAGATIRSLPIALTVGGSPGNVNTTLDFGLTVPVVVPPVIPPVVPPVVPPGLASVSGFVYRDNDLTATYTPGLRNDTTIGNVTVTLTGTDAAGNPLPPRTTTTNAQGFYEFTNVPAGNYTITETPPVGFYYHGADNPGSLGGTSPATRTLTVALRPNDAGQNYNFGELTPADPFGYVYADLNADGVRNAGEPGISGVAVTISGIAFAGTPFARPLTAADVPGGLTAVTNSTGRWEFPVMPPGVYSVVKGAVPSPYTDGLLQNGDPTAPPPQIGDNRFDNIVLTPRLARGPLNFGEIVPESTKRNFLASTPGLTGASLVRADVPMNPAFTVSTGRPGTPAYVAVGSGPGSLPLVRVFDYATGGEVFRFFAYESNFTGGVRVALGDVNGDGVPDIITGIGLGGGPRIRVFSGTDGSVLFDQFVYEPTFTGGLFVAAGDVNGDGRADIITGTDTGGGPRVRVLDGMTGAVLRDYFAFDPGQRGGVRVAAADFNTDGKADVVATTGPGVPTRVRVFGAGDATNVLADYAPYGADFTGGVFVAAGDVNGDGIPDIVTGADAGGGPRVQVFSGLTSQSVTTFFAFDPSFTGGVRVSLQDINGDGKADIVTGAGTGGGPAVRVYSGATGAQLDNFYATDPDNLGGVYVG